MFMETLPRIKMLKGTSPRSSRIVRIYSPLFDYLEERWKVKQGEHRDNPFVYGLGKDESGMLRYMTHIVGTSGCWHMPNLEVSAMTAAAVRMAKMGASINGIVRIGKFNLYREGGRGNEISDLTTFAPGFLILSIGNDDVNVETKFDEVKNRVRLSYIVIDKEVGNEQSNGSAVGIAVNEPSNRGHRRDVREVGRPSGQGAPDEGNHDQRVSEQAPDEVFPVSPRQPSNRRDGIRAEARRHRDNGDEVRRRKVALDFTDAETLVYDGSPLRRVAAAEEIETEERRDVAAERRERMRQLNHERRSDAARRAAISRRQVRERALRESEQRSDRARRHLESAGAAVEIARELDPGLTAEFINLMRDSLRAR